MPRDDLEQDHRASQLALRAATLADLFAIWPAFDLNRIGQTWGVFEAAAVTLIEARGRVSGGLASAYYRDARKEAGVEGRPVLKIETEPSGAVIAGLRAVGIINAGRQIALGRPVEDVRRTSLVNISGEVTRHVFNSGRLTLLGLLTADRLARPKAGRYRRQTDADPCLWCSHMASRTYPADARFRAHSHCCCFPVPLF